MAKKATTKKLEISLNVKERVLFPGILPNSGKKIETVKSIPFGNRSSLPKSKSRSSRKPRRSLTPRAR